MMLQQPLLRRWLPAIAEIQDFHAGPEFFFIPPDSALTSCVAESFTVEVRFGFARRLGKIL
jgi:hypothetical protein